MSVSIREGSDERRETRFSSHLTSHACVQHSAEVDSQHQQQFTLVLHWLNVDELHGYKSSVKLKKIENILFWTVHLQITFFRKKDF